MQGRKKRKVNVGEWEWAYINEALDTAGIWPIRYYVRIRWEKIAEYVSGRPQKNFVYAQNVE